MENIQTRPTREIYGGKRGKVLRFFASASSAGLFDPVKETEHYEKQIEEEGSFDPEATTSALNLLRRGDRASLYGAVVLEQQINNLINRVNELERQGGEQ